MLENAIIDASSRLTCCKKCYINNILLDMMISDVVDLQIHHMCSLGRVATESGACLLEVDLQHWQHRHGLVGVWSALHTCAQWGVYWWATRRLDRKWLGKSYLSPKPWINNANNQVDNEGALHAVGDNLAISISRCKTKQNVAII